MLRPAQTDRQTDRKAKETDTDRKNRYKQHGEGVEDVEREEGRRVIDRVSVFT